MQHSDVHVDRPLSNFAVEYKNEALIAPLVAPFVPVNNKSDSYMTFTKADKFSLPDDIRGPKSEAKETSWSSSTASYGCIDRALKDFVPDALAANADPAVNIFERTTGFLTDLLLLKHEKRVADLVTTYGNYPSSDYYTTLSGTNQLSDYDDSDPLSVIDTGKAACFKEPNTIIMGKAVYDKLKRHPQLLDYVKGGATSGDPAKIGLQQMAELFEVERILVGKAKYNSAVNGATASYADVWGKYIVIAHIDPAVSLENVSAWKTFLWNQVSTGVGFKVRRYRDEKRGGGGWEIEVEASMVEKAVCTDLAYLVINAVA